MAHENLTQQQVEDYKLAMRVKKENRSAHQKRAISTWMAAIRAHKKPGRIIAKPSGSSASQVVEGINKVLRQEGIKEISQPKAKKAALKVGGLTALVGPLGITEALASLAATQWPDTAPMLEKFIEPLVPAFIRNDSPVVFPYGPGNYLGMNITTNGFRFVWDGAHWNRIN